jgi:predicted O-methyltransferase YrrM
MNAVNFLKNVLKTKETFLVHQSSNKPSNIQKFGDNQILINACKSINAQNIIEVGSWFGNSSIAFANYLVENQPDNGCVICVDTWLGGLDHWISTDYTKREDKVDDEILMCHHFERDLNISNSEPNIYNEFLNNVSKSGYSEYLIPLRQTSYIGAKILKYFKIKADFIFIDGSHEYLDCYNDLVSYWPILNSGGIIAVDDLQFVTVLNAIQDFVNDNNLSTQALIYTEGNTAFLKKN